MAADLHVKPDVAKKPGWVPGEPTEDRGGWVEKTVDIYASVDSPPARGEKEHPKAAGAVTTAVIVCLALLCLLLLGLITGLVIRYSEGRDQLQSRYDAVVQQRDDLQEKLNASLCHLNSWYHISTEKRNWTESRQDCMERQSHLIIINSREEQEFLEHLDKRVWLGLTDVEEEGTWKWVDGTQLTTEYWNNGQPDGAGIPPNPEEDCVEYHAGSWRAWNDLSCLENNFWICERNIC